MRLKKILMAKLSEEMDQLADKAIDKLMERQDDLDKIADMLIEKGMNRIDELADALVEKASQKMIDALSKQDAH